MALLQTIFLVTSGVQNQNPLSVNWRVSRPRSFQCVFGFSLKMYRRLKNLNRIWSTINRKFPPPGNGKWPRDAHSDRPRQLETGFSILRDSDIFSHCMWSYFWISSAVVCRDVFLVNFVPMQLCIQLKLHHSHEYPSPAWPKLSSSRWWASRYIRPAAIQHVATWRWVVKCSD